MKKRPISLLVALCMAVTLLPVSAITAWAEDPGPPKNGKCGATGDGSGVTWQLTENTDDSSTYTLTISGSGAMEDYSTSYSRPWNSFCDQITSYNKIVVFIDRSPAECYNKFRMLWIGMYHLPQRRFSGGSNHSFFVEMLIS